MTAYKVRREALLRAHWTNLDGIGDDAEEGVHSTETLPAPPADAHELRVQAYAARIARGLPLRPGQRLTPKQRAELAQTDPDAPTAPTPKGKRGRKRLADDPSKPFALRLAKGTATSPAAAAEKAAKAFARTKDMPPVPPVVRAAFANAPDRDQLGGLWAAHVRGLAGRRSARR